VTIFARAWRSPPTVNGDWYRCLRHEAADQNLSPRLKGLLQDLYPESVHVRDVGLESADDVVVWAYANEHELVITSKDSDVLQLSFSFGHPLKVARIRRGNCSTSEIESILRSRYNDLSVFDKDEQGAFLALT